MHLASYLKGMDMWNWPQERTPKKTNCKGDLEQGLISRWFGTTTYDSTRHCSEGVQLNYLIKRNAYLTDGIATHYKGNFAFWISNKIFLQQHKDHVVVYSSSLTISWDSVSFFNTKILVFYTYLFGISSDYLQSFIKTCTYVSLFKFQIKLTIDN
jgi:hypothetical protein